LTLESFFQRTEQRTLTRNERCAAWCWSRFCRRTY